MFLLAPPLRHPGSLAATASLASVIKLHILTFRLPWPSSDCIWVHWHGGERRARAGWYVASRLTHRATAVCKLGPGSVVFFHSLFFEAIHFFF